MHDSMYFRDPTNFDGFRFAKKTNVISDDLQDSKASRLTDSSLDWMVWGLGKTVWFYSKAKQGRGEIS